MFEDLVEANRRYRTDFHDSGIAGGAMRRLAVLTCIDSRIDPLAMLGLKPGDAKILRNAGARVTDDALRSLIVSVNLLDVERICVVRHTDCAMAGHSDAEIAAAVSTASGHDASHLEFFAVADSVAEFEDDLNKIRECSLISDSVTVGGFVFDVRTGELLPTSY
jgi:carbonic anhydrase